jgi:hypothetical protein
LNAERLFHRCETVQILSGTTASSEPRRDRRKVPSMRRVVVAAADMDWN